MDGILRIWPRHGRYCIVKTCGISAICVLSADVECVKRGLLSELTVYTRSSCTSRESSSTPLQPVRIIYVLVGRQSKNIYARSPLGPFPSPGPARNLREVLRHIPGCPAREPRGQLRFLVPNEVVEWDIIMTTCVQQSFSWIVKWFIGVLRGHRRRHGLESHAAEVPRIPRSVNCTVNIRGLLEREDDTVDQVGDQSNLSVSASHTSH